MEISESVIAVVAILSIFVVPFAAGSWVLVALIKSRNKERSELIAQGIQPDLKRPAPNKYTSLRNGCLLIGLALGMIIGVIIELQTDYQKTISFLILSASAVLCLGLGYIVFYLLVGNKNIDEE